MFARAVLLFAICASFASAKGVRVSFSLTDPQIGPFPSDAFTVTDTNQKTKIRVAMPLPDCTVQAAVCSQFNLINQYDGFALQPRIHVRFSGPINPDTLRGGIYIRWLDKLRDDEFGMGPIGNLSLINEVVYDPATNTAYAKPDDALDQARRYAVIVTSDVKDTAGDPVEMDPALTTCIAAASTPYCTQVARAFDLATPKTLLPAPPYTITGLSVFTTMTATAFLESARKQLQLTNPAFSRPSGKSVFTVGEIAKIQLRAQTGTSQFTTTDLPVPFTLLSLAGLNRIAFGSFDTARYLPLSGAPIIPSPPTAQDPAVPTAIEHIPFQVYLPSGTKPAGGYPVVIVGHEFNGNRLIVPTALVPGLVGAGFAIIGFNAVGHGQGPDGTIIVTDKAGVSTSLPFGGRGVDLNGDGTIGTSEGSIILSNVLATTTRDSFRQDAIDTMQLVHALQMGMDLDGDGSVDLAPNQISYVGVSMGSFHGTLTHAVEPLIPSAVINVGGGSAVDTAVWSPNFRPILQQYLASRGLLNAGTDFNANLPLRYEPVRVNNVPGAIAIQDEIERLEWIETPGAPHAYAPHLKSTTLPGVPIKRTFFSFAVGDRTVPNPQNLLLLRTANMWENAVMFRADLVRQNVPAYPADPHGFIARIDDSSSLVFALAAQQQAAQFLKGVDGIPPLGAEFQPYFQPVTHLLEFLNFGTQ